MRNLMLSNSLFSYLVIVFAFLMSVGFCDAQITWVHTYGGVDDEGGYSVAQTTDGGYIVAGYTYSYGTADVSAYLVRTNEMGEVIWTQYFGDATYNVAQSVAQTSDGGFILAGYSGEYGDYDVYVVKTDETGSVQWTGTYGGSLDDVAYSIAQTNDGGYIIAGYSQSFDDGAWGDVYVLKLSSSGDTVWTRTFGDIDEDYAYSVKQTTDGGFIIAGYSRYSGIGDMYVIKLDALGELEWQRNYVGDVAYSVAQTSDGGYVIAGWIDYYDFDVRIIKIDAAGDTVWSRIFGGYEEDEGYSVAATSDGGCVVAGYTNSFGAGADDVYLLRLNSTGDTVWTRTFGDEDDEEGYCVAQTSDGGYVIAGYIEYYGSDEVYLIKTDSMGFVSISEKDLQEPDVISIDVYPNPFNSSCEINVPAQSKVSICDITGNVVYAPSEDGQNVHSQTRTIIWKPADEISSGMYFAKAVLNDGRVISERVIYLK